MKDNKKKPGEYFEKLEKWQKHQLNPYHWLGSNLPPFFKEGFAVYLYFFIIIGGIFLGMFTGIYLGNINPTLGKTVAVVIILLSLISSLFLYWLRYYRK